MQCPHCKKQLPDSNKKFCPFCGQKLSAQQISSPAKKKKSTASQESKVPRNVKKAPVKKKNKVLPVILGVLLLLILGGLGYFTASYFLNGGTRTTGTKAQANRSEERDSDVVISSSSDSSEEKSEQKDTGTVSSSVSTSSGVSYSAASEDTEKADKASDADSKTKKKEAVSFTPEEESSGQSAGNTQGSASSGNNSSGTTILHVKNTSEGVNVKDHAGTGDYTLIELDGSDISMKFTNTVKQGYGSDNALHDWYLITVSDIYGWVRSDMVAETGDGYYEKTVEGAMNIRSGAGVDTQKEAAIYDGTKLEYQGKTATGAGSDGKQHEWMYVKTVGTFQGWVRSDLTTG